MKKINVQIKDKNTLVLLEDALKGDEINLASVVNVDSSNIEKMINEEKEQIYLKRLNATKEQFELEKEKEINLLKSNLSNEYQNKINELNNKISNYELNKKIEFQSLENSKEKEIQLLKNEISNLKNSLSSLKENEKILIQNELLNSKLEYEGKYNELEKIYEEKIKGKDDIINNLRRQKASMNVKQTGEDLEAWCNNEVLSYMQNGLFNCTWNKDNIVIKEEDELKGSKADYIFNVYSSNKHLDNELLVSVCLEMKDENPDSINKKTNADYFKQLDKNRKKKNCKYALLVSNLEIDKANDLPLYRVNAYEDMYVVRPAYLMTFLNILVSLTFRFKELIGNSKIGQIELKKCNDFNEEFEKIKKSYLNDPLDKLTKRIDDIRRNNETIIKASKSIEDSIEFITRNYLNLIQNKLETFEVKINREYKKMNKD